MAVGRTGVCHGNRLRVWVAEAVSNGRYDGQHNGAGASKDAGPKEGGTLARCPAPVSEGLLPEEGRAAGHVDFCDAVRIMCAATAGGRTGGSVPEVVQLVSWLLESGAHFHRPWQGEVKRSC